eukprot:2162891-Rhodomonas_salina.1
MCRQWGELHVHVNHRSLGLPGGDVAVRSSPRYDQVISSPAAIGRVAVMIKRGSPATFQRSPLALLPEQRCWQKRAGEPTRVASR